MAHDALTELAAAAGHGDDRALAEFIASTTDKVRRVCAHLGSPGDADDLTQETYLRALTALPRYRVEAPAELWLLSIARHVCADHVRRRVRRAAIDQRYRTGAIGVASPDHSADYDDLLAQLDPDQRAALVLTRLVGLTYEEAAAVCECPVGTIRSRIARARGQLIELLTDHDARLTG